MEKTTVAFERDHAIDNLLATLSILNDLNVDKFTLEESQEYGWRLSCLSKSLLVSYTKSFEPEMYFDVWNEGNDVPEVAVKKDASKRKK